ncbi:MAG: ABC transporter permease subunit [Lachnospiraceae bacterium]|nr:ABC transporter permease subunit [Lachnospiraceae bacterium]
MRGLRTSKSPFVHLLIALVFLTSVILPILSMFTRITGEGFQKMISSPQFYNALRHSLITALASTLISLVLSLAAAYCVERTALPMKGLFRILFVIPILIPSISQAFGLVALFGNNGMLTRLFDLSRTIYGYPGIIAGSVLYSFPVAFLMFDSILQYEDGLPHTAARVLGVSAFRRFKDLTLPYLRRTIISAFFAIFTIAVTDYGVALMVGGQVQTLPVLMYNRAVKNADYASGSVVGAMLLIPAVIAFIIDVAQKERSQASFTVSEVEAEKQPVATALSTVFSVFISICILAPVMTFLLVVFMTRYPADPAFTLDHVVKTVNRGALTYLGYSVLYAFLTALIGTVFAFACAYATARQKGKLTRFVHLFSLTSMAIPGIVLGLSYIIFFNSFSFYGTIWIIVMVNAVHFFASPYLMMYNTLAKVNPNLEAVGLTLGVGRLRIIRDVILPKVRYTLFEMFAYFFVNSMMTISAVSFLSPPAPKPVALMINTFSEQRLMESAAFVSLLIFIVNLILRSLVQHGAKRAKA